jgi:predicted dehydrogenase
MKDRIRVGIVGANSNGSWGTTAHLPALRALPQFEVVAVATAHQSTAEQTAAAFGIPSAFGDPYQLIALPEVDVVSVCVRVPAHYDFVMAALDAGKHVYCEWPLGRDTAEAGRMTAAASNKSLIHMVGLQARNAPVLERARDLIAEGFIGTVHACSLNHSVDWLPVLPGSLTYLQDLDSGAHMLSIPGGHSIDALCWLLGEFTDLSATVKTRIAEITVAETGEKYPRTSPDQIVVNGELVNGAVACVRIQGAPSHGTGVRLEINGDKGDLVITTAPGARGIQMADLHLQHTVGPGALAELEVPASYFDVPAEVRSGPPLNVARSYQQLAAAIIDGAAVANFDTAVMRHRTLDYIRESAREGRRVPVK